MKKIVLKIQHNTRKIVLGLALLGAVGISALHKSVVKTTAVTSYAFLGLAASLKAKKLDGDKTAYDALDASGKSFVDGIDEVLKGIATSKLEQKDLDDKLEAFKLANGTGLNAEQLKEYNEIIESVKKQAQEIQKMKDNGFEAVEVQSYAQAFIKAVNEKKTEIAALKGQKNASVNLTFKAAAAMTTGNITATSSPQLPGTTVMTGLNAAPRNQPFILDFVDNGSVSTPTIMWFDKINRQNGSAMIAEGDLKPLSDFDIVGETATVKKVATRFNVSEEMLTDVPFIENEIRTEGVENLQLVIDDQILNGDGTGNNLKGILEYAGGYALPGLNNSTNDANEYDVILAGHTQLQTLNFNPNAVFVHPVTRYKLRTIKDSQGRYVIPPSQDSTALNIDGLPIVAKNQITVGDFLMGDMTKSHVRFLMDINVRVGYDGDDFSHNRLTFLVEARLTHFIKDVETSAFIYASFDAVKALLETP